MITNPFTILIWTPLFCLLTLPCFGLTTLSDQELAQVSGQSGVGIYIDHTYLYRALDQRKLKDPDGLPGIDDDGAYLDFNGFELDVLRIEALAPMTSLYDASEQHVQWNAQFTVADSDYLNTYTASIMSIDFVDELPAMSMAANYKYYQDPNQEEANIVGVCIRLPTMEWYVDEAHLDSISMEAPGVPIYNNGFSFGRFKATKVQCDLLGGDLELAPHQSSGMDIWLDDVILYAKIEQFTYYDEDGVEDSNRQFRIKDFKMDVLRVNAITHLDSSGQPQSPGNPVHLRAGTDSAAFNTQQTDNYDFSGDNWRARPLSIDLSNNLPTMSALHGNQPVAGILIGLPAEEFFIDRIKFQFTVGEEDDEWLGKIKLVGLEMAILEGSLEIAPHNEYGMDIALDDVVMYVSLDKLKYNDIDDHGYLHINDFEMDMLQINAIARTTDGQLYSPGTHDIHLTQDSSHLDPNQAPAEFQPGALTFDISARLPKATAQQDQPVAGLAIGLPSVEFYTDQIGIGSITLHYERGEVNNDEAPLFQSIRLQGATSAILGGRMEIFPHQ